HPVVVPHSAQPLGIAPLGNRIVEHYDLIALQAGFLVDGLRIQTSTVESFFRSRDKERSALMHAVESAKVEVTTIHQVDCSGLPDQLIENIDLVDLSTGDDHHRGDTAAKIEQGVKFDGGFVSAELSPRKKRQTQIDGGRIEGVHSVVQFESKRFAFVQSACFLDQCLGKVRVDAPVADLIGVGQSVARDGAANPHVVELLARGTQARLDVSETLAISKLGKG